MSSLNNLIKLADLTFWARKIHVYSAIPLTLAMVFFALTGFLLNHPYWQFGDAASNTQTLTPPEFVLSEANWESNYHQNALNLLLWLDKNQGVSAPESDVEWDDGVLILTLQGPGKHLLVELDIETKELVIEQRTHSLLGLLNNVHRGKHVSGHWRLLSDLSAILMFLFCVSGLVLMILNRVQRQTQLPIFLVGSAWFGFAIWLMH